MFELHKQIELTLGKTHDKDEVHGSKFQQIICQHSVDHNDKRPGQFESTAEEEEVTSS